MGRHYTELKLCLHASQELKSFAGVESNGTLRWPGFDRVQTGDHRFRNLRPLVQFRRLPGVEPLIWMGILRFVERKKGDCLRQSPVVVSIPTQLFELYAALSDYAVAARWLRKSLALATSASHFVSCSGVRKFWIFSRPALRFLAIY